MKCNRVTKENLKQKMQIFSEIYDIARLVDPEELAVYKFENEKLIRTELDSCFSVWNKDERCENCISFKACRDNRKATKFEFRNHEAYHVLSIPYTVDLGDGEKTIALELVNRVSADFEVDTQDKNTEGLIKAITAKSYEDSLTGTYNRRYYDENRFVSDNILNMSCRVGFIMCDVNKFKYISNKYGRAHGDEVLIKVGEILKKSFRNSDSVIRIEEDVFLAILMDCNPILLEKKVERIKKAVSKIEFDWLKDEILTVSAGISFSNEFEGRKEQVEGMYVNADKAMHKDKLKPTLTSFTKTILIVENEKKNRMFLKEYIGNKFNLIAAESVESALLILKDNHIDVIVTDISDNPLNGYEFMKNVRSSDTTKNIPIIAINENSETTHTTAIDAGADYYIDSATNSDLLVDSIMQITSDDQGRRDLFDVDFVLNSIPGAVMVCKYHENNPEMIYCSRGVHSITGLDSNEVFDWLNDNGTDTIYPADRQKFIDCLEKIARTRSRGEVIYRAYKQDGSLVWLWMQGRYLGEEDGSPIIEEIILDVSKSTNMYESILDESPSLITVIDAEQFEVLYANDCCIATTGNPVGKKCYKHFMNCDKPCEDCVLFNTDGEYKERKIKYKGRDYKQSFKRIKWNGRSALLEYTGDITEQLALQAYVESERNTLRETVKNVPAGLFVFEVVNGSDIIILEANESACNYMGINYDLTIGQDTSAILELVHPNDRDEIIEMLNKLSNPDTTVQFEYRQYNKVINEYSWLAGIAHSVKQSDGNVYIYINYFDMTEQKKAQKLKEDLQIARKESQAKTDFMSNMSHDMRTPLNGILGLSYLMLDKNNIDELHEDAKQLIMSGKLLLRLINDTLDMNRIASGKMRLNLSPMDSVSLFKNIMMTVGMLSQQTGINIEYDLADIPEDKWVPVVTDESRLEQILINVITNAIKYSRPGGTVELHMKTVAITEDEVFDEYKIVDHGIGMSQEFLGHLFEPFVQEGRGYSQKIQGSGLGMSIVKQLVDLMDGTISVESTINEGTAVTIQMKYKIYKGEILHIKDEEKIAVNIEGMKVLLCEDNPLNIQIVEQLLDTKGVIVHTAEDGRKGLEKFCKSEEGFYDAILMDVRMPIMDGIETTKAIRGLDRRDARLIPILAMTANAFTEDIQQTSEAGMNEHLAKPVQPDLLFETLTRYYR